MAVTTEQRLWTQQEGWTHVHGTLASEPAIVFVFGGRAEVQQQEHFEYIRSIYPNAPLLFCSTAGEILGTYVYDHSLCVTAVSFESTQLTFAQSKIAHVNESEEKGRELVGQLPHEGLSHVMVFSDGLTVNGTALVAGLTSGLPEGVSVTGGLVADGADFLHTVTGLNELPSEKNIIVIGFYGDDLSIGYGSLGGWDTFGPDRTITRSEGNVLYELDGRPALELYKEYLGPLAQQLPGSGLLFPLRLNLGDKSHTDEVVRTLLAIDEASQSMTFAGDMPIGVSTTLMKANFERLIDGATGAAQMSASSDMRDPQLALLISCVGRKLVLKDRIEEETEAVRSILGESTVMTGFYSYGEICPVAPTEKQCRLHNQTMTITTFKES